MKKLFLSAAALVLLFAACSKDDNPTPGTPDIPQTHGKYLQYLLTSVDSVRFTYDTANNIIGEGRWGRIDALVRKSLVFRENGKIKQVDRLIADDVAEPLRSFEYNSAGNPSKIFFYNTFSDGTKYDSLLYNADGRLTTIYSIATYLAPPNQIDGKTIFTWDSKGNVTKEVVLNIFDGVESKDSLIIDYIYDDKVNYFAKQPELFLIEGQDPVMWQSANNAIQYVERKSSLPAMTTTVTSVYTYDEDGYIVEKKATTKTVNGTQEDPADEDVYRYGYIKK